MRLRASEPAPGEAPKAEEPLRSYGWRSWPEYLKNPGQRWPWRRVERLLGEHGIPQDKN